MNLEDLRQGVVFVPWTSRLVGVAGLLLMLVIAWALSSDRRRLPWRVIIWGVLLQLVFGFLVLRTSPGRLFFSEVNKVFIALLGFTREGASFLFGNLVHDQVPVSATLNSPALAAAGAEVVEAGSAAATAANAAAGSGAGLPTVTSASGWADVGAMFAFMVLPTIIFFSSLMAVLYHAGIMQRLVRAMAWTMRRTMGTSGAESMAAAGNVFVGQLEAPLMVRPFIPKMTNSELMSVMTGGFATVAGGVMAAYVGMLMGFFPDIGGHLLAASVMSAPAALVIAKVMVPEREVPATTGAGCCLTGGVDDEEHVNIIDAACRGATDGLKLALNVGAVLLAFIALIALFNGILGWVGGLLGWQGASLQAIFGYILAPIAWVLGVPGEDAMAVGSLLGIRTTINEFVAYLHLKGMLESGAIVHGRSVVIATYALCGFANFSSIAIQIGGIGALAPESRPRLARLGLRAMIGGTLAAFMTAAVAGILL